jgi:hypothetical protein
MRLFRAHVIEQRVQEDDKFHPARTKIVLAESLREAAEAALKDEPLDIVLCAAVEDLRGATVVPATSTDTEFRSVIERAFEEGREGWFFLKLHHVRQEAPPYNRDLHSTAGGMRSGIRPPDLVRGVEVGYSDAYFEKHSPFKEKLYSRRGRIAEIAYYDDSGERLDHMDSSGRTVIGVDWHTPGFPIARENVLVEDIHRVA